jgi:hypothetical protein
MSRSGLFTSGRETLYQLNRRLIGTRRGCGHFWKVKNLFLFPGIQNLDRSIRLNKAVYTFFHRPAHLGTKARSCAYQLNKMNSTKALNIAVNSVTSLLDRAVVILTECLHGLPQFSQTSSGKVTQIASQHPSFMYFTIYYLLTLIKFDTLKYIFCTSGVKVFRNAKLTNNSILNRKAASSFETLYPTNKTAWHNKLQTTTVQKLHFNLRGMHPLCL